MPKKPKIPENVMDYFRKTGAQGGTERAKRYSQEQLAEWGKKGGRPRKASQDQNAKEGNK